jgi:hypothetical protein
MGIRVNYFNRLDFLSTQKSKSQIARDLGISRQRLNYWFKTSNIPISFLSKSNRSKLNYRFFKGTTTAKADGYRKRYSNFIIEDFSILFKKIKLFGLSINSKLIQARFNFYNKNNYYSPSTQVYSFSDGFTLFKQEVKSIWKSYNVLPYGEDPEGSRDVASDYNLEVTFFY